MKIIKMSRLIIFDCDGVLVDSEPLSNQVIAEILCEIGIPMTTKEAIGLFAGGSLKRVSDFVVSKTGQSLSPEYEAIYRRRSYALFREALQPIPGVHEAIEKLPFSKCVASNGPLQKMKLNLNITGLDIFFGEYLFSAYEVGYWKPDPRLFLHAAEKMGFYPSDCIVIEDSIHGIRAAKSAGMKVLGFSSSTHEDQLKSENIPLFHSMTDLADILNTY